MSSSTPTGGQAGLFEARHSEQPRKNKSVLYLIYVLKKNDWIGGITLVKLLGRGKGQEDPLGQAFKTD